MIGRLLLGELVYATGRSVTLEVSTPLCAEGVFNYSTGGVRLQPVSVSPDFTVSLRVDLKSSAKSLLRYEV